MHMQYELEHYYSLGTWPSEKVYKQNPAQQCRFVGFYCEQLISSLANIGTELMEVRPLTIVSIVNPKELADYFSLVETAKHKLASSTGLSDTTISTSTKQPNN